MDDWFFELLANVHTEVTEYEYRLYYKDDGSLDHYAMCATNSPAVDDMDYILVDKEIYDNGLYFGKVENGELILQQKMRYLKLVPSNNGTPCHASNVMLIDSNSKNYWTLKEYYED